MPTYLSYPANLTQLAATVPYIIFTFRKPDGSSSEQTPIALFAPPSFQINDGQEYEFAQKGKFTQALSAIGGAFTGEGGIKTALDAILRNIDPALAAQAAAERGEAARDPKFFNYKEPKPREFTFNYKFEPKNEQDANSMLAIINALRRVSYPELLQESIYGLPDRVDLTFVNLSTGLVENLQVLAIKDVNTTLSEGDQVITLANGVPSQVSLQIQMAETKIISKYNGRLTGERPLLTDG